MLISKIKRVRIIRATLTAELDVKVPLDVVFILDTSGSMINTTYNGVTSANIMVESLNNIMQSILEDNEDNRVGVVCYSNGTKKLLDLGRYTADDNEFFEEGIHTNRDNPFQPSDSIQRTDGTLYKGAYTDGWAAPSPRRVLQTARRYSLMQTIPPLQEPKQKRPMKAC